MCKIQNVKNAIIDLNKIDLLSKIAKKITVNNVLKRE